MWRFGQSIPHTHAVDGITLYVSVLHAVICLLLQVKTEEEEHTVDDLNEGKKYMFHVAAENEVGIGEFVELPEAAIPKSGFGESHS